MFTKKFGIWAAMVVAGSLFVSGVEGGCWNLGSESLMLSIQPCAILDCSQGLFGGAIDPCGQPNNPADDVFVGCP